MRLGIQGWVVLAALWAGHAGAVEVGGADEPSAELLDCAKARVLLQQQAPVDPQHLKLLEELCEVEASQPRHDAETLAAIEQWQRDHLAAIGRQARMWLVSRDAHEQLAAGLLLPMLHMRESQAEAPQAEPQWSHAQARAAFAAARALAPGDPLVAWLAVVSCPGLGVAAGSGCESEAALVRLQQRDADNAAVWLQGLGSASPESKESAQLLAKAAASSRYETPFGATGRLLTEVLRQVDVPPPSPHVAAALGLGLGLDRPATRRDLDGVVAMGISSALALPVSTRGACSGEGDGMMAQRRAQCIAIHTLMSEEPTAVSQAMALTRLVLLTADQPEGAGWRERLREHYWVWDNASALMRQGVPEDYLDAVWRDGELVALKGLLRAAGMPLAPPAGWLPDSERRRSLVTTGREAPRR